jgi:hypothetical protein
MVIIINGNGGLNIMRSKRPGFENKEKINNLEDRDYTDNTYEDLFADPDEYDDEIDDIMGIDDDYEE